jgi:nucleoid DNA-binding protein
MAENAKTTTAGKAPTKSEVLTAAAESAGISRKQAAAVMESLAEQIKKNVGKKGPGMFTVPGLMKITVVNKPATKARKGVNPFTKEEQMFKAKPARRVIKVRPLKTLKDFAK